MWILLGKIQLGYDKNTSSKESNVQDAIIGWAVS